MHHFLAISCNMKLSLILSQVTSGGQFVKALVLC